MGAADMILFALLALTEVCLMVHLYHRRVRRVRSERMMRSLRSAVEREIGAKPAVVAPARWTAVLQRAS
jgi:hypothetical protein